MAYTIVSRADRSRLTVVRIETDLDDVRQRRHHVLLQNILQHAADTIVTLSPRGRRDDMPPPIAVRLVADLRPSADGSAVRIWLSCRQQHAYRVGSCASRAAATWDRHTDIQTYRLLTSAEEGQYDGAVQ